FACVGDFVQEGFDGETRVRMAHRTPPLHGNAYFGRVEIDLDIWNAVENISGTFNGCRVNAVLDENFERSASHDGLTDNSMCPSDGIAFSIESGGKTVVPFGAIPTAGEIVFARPDNFDGSFGNFGDVRRFHDEIGSRICAAAETATEKSGVEFHFFGRKPGDRGGIGAINSFE